MPTTLKFNRVHKNGWLSYKIAGLNGAIFIDRRMLSTDTLASPPAELTVEFPGILEPGADVSAKQAEKLKKQQEREEAKAKKAQAAIEKANARMAKLQEQAQKAAEKAAAAAAKAGTVEKVEEPVAQ